MDDRYQWELLPDSDIILIRPARALPKSPLDRRIEVARTEEMTVLQALCLDPSRRVFRHGPPSRDDDPLAQRVIIARGRYAVRNLLNQILAQHDMYWVQRANALILDWMPNHEVGSGMATDREDHDAAARQSNPE
jgi:hypothetical protein